MRYSNRKNGITLGYGDVFSIRDEKHGTEEYQEYRSMIRARPYEFTGNGWATMGIKTPAHQYLFVERNDITEIRPYIADMLEKKFGKRGIEWNATPHQNYWKARLYFKFVTDARKFLEILEADLKGMGFSDD